MMKKILALVVVGLLFMPAFADVVSAGSYYYKGKAYVYKQYRHVGYTPQKIVIKTNIDYDKSPFGKTIFQYYGGYWTANKLTIKLYSWATYPNKHWFIQDQKTYVNKFNGLKCTHHEFSVKVGYYWKWYNWWWHRCVKFTITIPKDKSFYHHNSGKTKIYVELRIGGVEVNLKTMRFSNLNMVVKAWGSYKTYPTPWDDYKKYWGYSASAQEYSQIMAQQNNTAGEYISEPVELSGVDWVLLAMFVLGVSILSYVYVDSKKNKR